MIKRRISLFAGGKNDKFGLGVYADLEVFDDTLEEEEYMNGCKMNIGYAPTWEKAIPMAARLANKYKAKFDKQIYI